MEEYKYASLDDFFQSINEALDGYIDIINKGGVESLRSDRVYDFVTGLFLFLEVMKEVNDSVIIHFRCKVVKLAAMLNLDLEGLTKNGESEV